MTYFYVVSWAICCLGKRKITALLSIENNERLSLLKNYCCTASVIGQPFVTSPQPSTNHIRKKFALFVQQISGKSRYYAVHVGAILIVFRISKWHLLVNLLNDNKKNTLYARVHWDTFCRRAELAYWHGSFTSRCKYSDVESYLFSEKCVAD